MNGAGLLLVLLALAVIAANYLTEGPAVTETEPDATPTCEVRGCTAPRMDDHFCGYHGPQW